MGFPHIILLGTFKKAISLIRIKFQLEVFVIMPPCCCLYFGSVETSPKRFPHIGNVNKAMSVINSRFQLDVLVTMPLVDKEA